MTKKSAVVRINIIQGPEGPHVQIGIPEKMGIRVAGPKAWGGGTCVRSWDCDREQFIDDMCKLFNLERKKE